MIIEYKLEVIHNIAKSIIQRVVTSSVIFIQLQAGKHTEHIIDDRILVDLVVQLCECGEGAIDRCEIGGALDVHHLYPSCEVQVEQSVIIAAELLHLIEHCGLQNGQVADHCPPCEEPHHGGAIDRSEGVLGDVVVAINECFCAILCGIGVGVIVGDGVDISVCGCDSDELREVADPAAQELAVLPLQQDVEVFVAVVGRGVRVDLHDREHVAGSAAGWDADPPPHVVPCTALRAVVGGELGDASRHGREAEAGDQQLRWTAGGAESIDLRGRQTVVMGCWDDGQQNCDKQYGNLFFHLIILEIALRTFAASSEISLQSPYNPILTLTLPSLHMPLSFAWIYIIMFLIIHDDKPIYQLQLNQPEMTVKDYFLVHAALDNIDLSLRTKRDYFLGQIRSDDLTLYSYVNAVQIKFILMLGQKREIDKNLEKYIKEFFTKVNEGLAVALLNPLYHPREYIRSPIFEEKVKMAAKESLRTILVDKKK